MRNIISLRLRIYDTKWSIPDLQCVVVSGKNEKQFSLDFQFTESNKSQQERLPIMLPLPFDGTSFHISKLIILFVLYNMGIGLNFIINYF